jgi:hypothetical protein
MLYCNIKGFKKSNFWEFWALIEHGSNWINFIIFIFTSEKNRFFIGLCKIWNKIISFDMKKRMKCKIGHGKNEKKCEFGFKCGTPIMFGPRFFCFLQLVLCVYATKHVVCNLKMSHATMF